MISPMRRVTIPVAEEKWAASLRFYRQVLGMEVFYEAELDSPQQAALLGVAGDLRAHLTVLRTPGSDIGMVGLMQYSRPSLSVHPFVRQEGRPYPIYFVCSAQNIPEIHARALAEGSVVIRPPTVTQVLGTSTRMMVCLDPNGVYVELMESTVNDDVAGRGGPLRRVTIPVPPGTCDAAVSFYTDLMGLKPLIDRELSGTPQTSVLSSSLGIGDFRLRIVSLQQGDVDHGMVGLIEYFEPKLTVEALDRAANEPFQAMFVFLTDDIQAVRARAQALGSPIVCPPLAVDIPQRGQALEMTCLDPNGVLLAFTQFRES